MSFIPVAAVILLAMPSPGCSPKKSTDETVAGSYYTCPMHPEIHEDNPGTCPVCGMKLVKVMPTGSTDTASLDSALGYLTEPVTRTVVGSFSVIEPVSAVGDAAVAADGYITFDPGEVHTVSARVSGRVERLYTRYTNRAIRKGQPLMEIYSPELLRVQKELLQVIKDRDQSLIQPLRQQLVNLGMQPAEIQEVVKKGKPLSRVTVDSPCDGISSQLGDGRFSGPPAPDKMAGGGTQAADENPEDPGADRGRGANQTEPLKITEGMYVDKGQSVFCIQNTDRLWAVLNVFTSDIWRIRPGDSVRLYADADPATVLKRRVDLIAPYRSGDERTTRIRIYLDRIPRNWKVNTLIHGRILTTGRDTGVRVPASSVNRLGGQNVIWVQDKRHAHVFHARKVETGVDTDDSLQILSGVLPGEKIVRNAAYMVDGDSFIR